MEKLKGGLDMALVAAAWTVVLVVVFALVGCGEVNVTKDVETSGFFCFGVCTQKTTDTKVELNRVPANVGR